MRTLETLEMFRDSARQQPGQKLPLLVYVHHLLQCAPAYQPISLQESIQCAQCLIQQGQTENLELGVLLNKIIYIPSEINVLYHMFDNSCANYEPKHALLGVHM